MKKLCLQDLDLASKRILVRVDFNVPLNERGEITDDTRIRAALPTIRYILDHGGTPILMSHLGRPKGQVNPKLSLKPCADRLSQLLDTQVVMAPNTGPIVMLENLRFHPGEEHPEKEPGFAKQLSQYGDLFVNDAFGTAHRAHTSMVGITKYFPGKSAAGFLLQKEIEYLGETFANPNHPFIAIIGGAKVSSKMGLLKSLSSKVDTLLIGGGMAYTFMKGRGIEVGKSLLEPDLVATTKEIKAILPVDLKIAAEFKHDAPYQVVPADQDIPSRLMGLDIGPQTVEMWKPYIENAKTIFWNGPVGAFELPAFAQGTIALAKLVAASPATSIIGGGDSIAAIKLAGVGDQISHISTGGGATLEYLEFGHLPGVDSLSDSVA